MANVKITLSGGAHNAGEINVLIPEKIARALYMNQAAITEPHILTRAQRLKLDRHFCGRKGCKCGGIAKAKITYPFKILTVVD